eukprot:365192-Chlamydomonas_euryale.AAC.12
MLQLWTVQPPLAEWIRRGQPAHTPPQRPQQCVRVYVHTHVCVTPEGPGCATSHGALHQRVQGAQHRMCALHQRVQEGPGCATSHGALHQRVQGAQHRMCALHQRVQGAQQRMVH